MANEGKYASLKPLVDKIQDDISVLQKADPKQFQNALNALTRDVKQLAADMSRCSYTLTGGAG
jgi:hypothetical protein